jgi:hypothetical protein
MLLSWWPQEHKIINEALKQAAVSRYFNFPFNVAGIFAIGLERHPDN